MVVSRHGYSRLPEGRGEREGVPCLTQDFYDSRSNDDFSPVKPRERQQPASVSVDITSPGVGGQSCRSARIKVHAKDRKTLHWSLFADIHEGKNVHDHEELSYGRVECALVTRLIKEKRKGQDDSSPADPTTSSEAVSGDHSKGRIKSIRDKCRSLEHHDVFE